MQGRREIGVMGRTIALRLAYDGRMFVGSQWQTNGRSVQGELERAWLQFTQEARRFVFAGRTDSGVHAQGQVANVVTATRHTTMTVQRALNAILADDVAVIGAWEVDATFHARFTATWRKYWYFLDQCPVGLPQLRQNVLHVGAVLDEEAVRAALGLLEGEHDFAAFASVQADDGPTVRRCYRATCVPVEWLGRRLLCVEVVANGFLRHMVRTIVGSVLLVGQQRMTVDTFEEVLVSRDRGQAGPTAAAHGLTLAAVGYPRDRVPPEMYIEM